MHLNPLRNLTVLACVLSLLSACQDAPVPAAAPGQPIIQNNQIRYPADHPQLALLTTQAAKLATNLKVELPAKLVWNEERTQRIYPAFSGRVVGIHVDVGQSVEVGNRLAQLASPEFGMAQADAARAHADLSLAQKQLRRQQELYEAGVVARKDLEQSQADVSRAEAEFARANSRVRLYSSVTGVDQNLALASGIHGVVVERNINPGQELRADLGGPGTPPLFVITDPQQLWAQIDAREIDLHSLKPGQDILIKVPTLPEAFFKAQIHAGGRGKGKIQGSEQKGVAVGKSAEEIKTIAGNILGGTLVTLQTGPAGKVVNKILVAQDVYYSGSTPTREF